MIDRWPIGRQVSVGVGSVAALAAGAVISFHWQVISPQWAFVLGVRLADLAVVLSAIVTAVSGAAVSIRSVRPSTGWLAATGALAALAVLVATSPGVSVPIFRAVVAVLVGLALGGVLAAAALGEHRERMAIAVALSVGFLTATELTAFVQQAVPNGWGLVVIAASLCAVAVAVAVRGAANRATSPGRWQWMPVAIVAAVGVGVWLVASVRFSLLESLLYDAAGGPSARRTEVVEAVDQMAVIAVPLAIALALGAYAYRAGGRALARWVIVAAGASYTFITLSVVSSVSLPAVVLVGVIAAVGGAAAAARADRFLPWDAVGLLLCAWTTIALATFAQSRSFGASPEWYLFLTGCLAFTLGAGLGGGVRSRAVTRVGLVNAVLLGLVGLILSAQMVRLLFPEPDFRYVESYPIAIPIIMSLMAVLLAMLWGMEKLVDKLRRDVHAEASGAAP